MLYVLNAEQHAIWLTEQLSKWHRQSLEVRDREMQLHETNKQLRLLSPEELDQPETRRRIESPVRGRAGQRPPADGPGRRGEDLVQQAMRNPEFGVGHLEKWAEMLQILKDISANRMPTVADLLKQSSQAQGLRANVARQSRRRWPARSRGAAAGSSRQAEPRAKAAAGRAARSSTANRRSSRATTRRRRRKSRARSNSQPRLTLPVTTVAGRQLRKSRQAHDARRARKLDEAVKAQQDLLAEFEKIADELNGCWPTSKGARWSSGSRRPRGCSTSSPAGSATRSSDTFGRRGHGSAGADEGARRAVQGRRRKAARTCR